MNVVDSSAWLEYFADGPNAAFFRGPVENTAELLVPTLSLFEVFKRVFQQRSENEALQVVAAMQQGRPIDLDARVALTAARISIDDHLPMADSVMLATARLFNATFWTQDSHFESIAGVKYKSAAR
jgi:toxin FitB